MNKVFYKHIELLEKVNNSKTAIKYDLAYYRLIGFRDALDCLNIAQLMACDMHYLDQGIDRPMCAGVFLDWEPELNQLPQHGEKVNV